MNHKKTFYGLILTTFPLFLCLSCNEVPESKTAKPQPSEKTSTLQAPPADTICEEDATVEVETKTAEAPKNNVVTQKKSTVANPGGKETLYISTYGANGKVWGHVTMNGKTGRGTIHDEDENSYSITVTRHGGELFGTDQNGRQYVFKM